MQDAKVIEQLLDIYAHSKYNLIGQDTAYRQLFKQYGSKLWFEEAQAKIAKVKTWLEENVAIQKSTKNQVIECLRLLRKRKANDDEVGYKYALKLIKTMFFNNWKSTQQIFFEDTCQIMENCPDDYFLSFTDRRDQADEIDMLHLNHQYFIRHILGIDSKRAWLKRVKENKNLLAEAINKILRHRLKGFYYHWHKEDNSIVETKLEQRCKKCFAFIQLVQNILFEKPERTNYCHCEYVYAEQQNKSRLYILAERSHDDLKDINDVDEQYDKWLKEIKSKDKVQLKCTEIPNPKLVRDMKDKIVDKIAKKIQSERKQLFENVPD